MNQAVLIAAAFLSVIWVATSVAAPPPADGADPQPQALMEKLDANADGQITFVEYRDVWEQRMEKRFQWLVITAAGYWAKTRSQRFGRD